MVCTWSIFCSVIEVVGEGGDGGGGGGSPSKQVERGQRGGSPRAPSELADQHRLLLPPEGRVPRWRLSLYWGEAPAGPEWRPWWGRHSRSPGPSHFRWSRAPRLPACAGDVTENAFNPSPTSGCPGGPGGGGTRSFPGQPVTARQCSPIYSQMCLSDVGVLWLLQTPVCVYYSY